jgi:phosphomannomutase / phosphoglucomutase
MLKPTIFREYDIRGIADLDLLSDGIEQLGQAIGTYLRRRAGNRVHLGRDTRLSSPRLRDALMKGLLKTGCEVTDIGVVPTPVLYYSAYKHKPDGAVMITGSHNPSEYNGFKVVCGAGTIHGAEIQALLALIQKQDFESGTGIEKHASVAPAYVDEIAAMFHFGRRIKVVLDAGNGTAGPVMQPLLAKLNCEPVELFYEMDGNFPNHHPDPTVEKNLEHLAAAVKEHKADLGIAFDGDTDRIGAVDENGVTVWGDQLMLIYAKEILTRKPGATFIGEVKCSQVMYDGIRKLGGNAIMYKTGHSLIKAKMKEVKAELAGEMSGHIFFEDRYFGYDDAMYAACRLIEIVERSGKPLSAQLADVPKTVTTPEIRIDCPDEAKFAVVKLVAEHFRKIRETIDVDGVRVIFAGGWGLLRASNTQPVLVMRFEATTPELLAEYQKEMDAALALAKQSAGV